MSTSRFAVELLAVFCGIWCSKEFWVSFNKLRRFVVWLSRKGTRKGNMINKIKGKIVAVAIGASALLPVAARAQAPSSLDGFTTVATGYISSGTTVAIAAAVLGFGWVGYTIVKKFTKGAKST